MRGFIHLKEKKRNIEIAESHKNVYMQFFYCQFLHTVQYTVHVCHLCLLSFLEFPEKFQKMFAPGLFTDSHSVKDLTSHNKIILFTEIYC